MWDLPGQGIELTSPALAGEPLGKSLVSVPSVSMWKFISMLLTGQGHVTGYCPWWPRGQDSALSLLWPDLSLWPGTEILLQAAAGWGHSRSVYEWMNTRNPQRPKEYQVSPSSGLSFSWRAPLQHSPFCIHTDAPVTSTQHLLSHWSFACLFPTASVGSDPSHLFLYTQHLTRVLTSNRCSVHCWTSEWTHHLQFIKLTLKFFTRSQIKWKPQL